MIKIADFNSVLQIAFGLNALFYAFDLVPQTETRIRELADKHQKLADKKIELTKNHEVYPIGFVVSSTYSLHKRILSRLSLLISVIAFPQPAGATGYSGRAEDGFPHEAGRHGAGRHAGYGGKERRAGGASDLVAPDGGVCAERGVAGFDAAVVIRIPECEHQPRTVAAGHADGAEH